MGTHPELQARRFCAYDCASEMNNPAGEGGAEHTGASREFHGCRNPEISRFRRLLQASSCHRAGVPGPSRFRRGCASTTRSEPCSILQA